jgi:hypothetical protein
MFRAFTLLKRRSFNTTGVAEAVGEGEVALIDPEPVNGEADAVACGGGGEASGAVSFSWPRMNAGQAIIRPTRMRSGGKERGAKSIGIPSVILIRRPPFCIRRPPGLKLGAGKPSVPNEKQ